MKIKITKGLLLLIVIVVTWAISSIIISNIDQTKLAKPAYGIGLAIIGIALTMFLWGFDKLGIVDGTTRLEQAVRIILSLAYISYAIFLLVLAMRVMELV